MLSWLSENLANLIVCGILLIVVVLIVRKLIRDKKAGKHICGGSCGSCGGGCGGCPMQGQCHRS